MNMMLGLLITKPAPRKTHAPMQGPTQNGQSLDTVLNRKKLIEQARQVVDPKRQAHNLRVEQQAHQHRLAIAAKKEKLATEIASKPKSQERKQTIHRMKNESAEFEKNEDAKRRVAEYRKLAGELDNLDKIAKKRNEGLSLQQIDQARSKLEHMHALVPTDAKAKDGFYSELARKDMFASADKTGDISVQTARKIKRETIRERAKVKKRLQDIAPRQEALEEIGNDLEAAPAAVATDPNAPSALQNEKFRQWVQGKLVGGADAAKVEKLVQQYNKVAALNGHTQLSFDAKEFYDIAGKSGLSQTLTTKELNESIGVVTVKDANGFTVNSKAQVMSALDSEGFAKYLRENAAKNGLQGQGMSLSTLNTEVRKFNELNPETHLVLDEKANALFSKLAYDPQEEGDVHRINLGSLNRVDAEIRYAKKTPEEQLDRKLKILVLDAKMDHEKLVAAEIAERPENKGFITWTFAQPANWWHSGKDALGLNDLHHGRKIGRGAVEQRLKESEASITELEEAVKTKNFDIISAAYEKNIKARHEAVATVQQHVQAIHSGSKVGEIIVVSASAVGITVWTLGAGAPLAGSMVVATVSGMALKTSLDAIDAKTGDRAYTENDLRMSLGEGGLAGFTSVFGGAVANKATALTSRFGSAVTSKLGVTTATGQAATKLSANIVSDGIVGSGNATVRALAEGDYENLGTRARDGFLGGMAFGGAMRVGGIGIAGTAKGIQYLAQNSNQIKAGLAIQSTQLNKPTPVNVNAPANGSQYQVNAPANVSVGTSTTPITVTVPASGTTSAPSTPVSTSTPPVSASPNTGLPNFLTPQGSTPSGMPNLSSAQGGAAYTGGSSTPITPVSTAPTPVVSTPNPVPGNVLNDLSGKLRLKDAAQSEAAIAELLKTADGQIRLAKELKSRAGSLNGGRDRLWNNAFNVIDDANPASLNYELVNTLRDHSTRSLRGRLSPRVNKENNQIIASQKVDLTGFTLNRANVRDVRQLLGSQYTAKATQEAIGQQIQHNPELVTKFIKNPGGKFSDRTARRVGMIEEMENVSLKNLSPAQQKDFLKALDKTMKNVDNRSLRGRRSAEANNMVDALGKWYASTDDATRAMLVQPIARVTRVWSMRNGPGQKAREILGSQAGNDVQNALALQLRNAKSARERLSIIESLTAIGKKDGLTFGVLNEIRHHQSLFKAEFRRPIGDKHPFVRSAAKNVLKEPIKIKIDAADPKEGLRLTNMLNDPKLRPIAIRSCGQLPSNPVVTQKIESMFNNAKGLGKGRIQKSAMDFFASLDDAAFDKLSLATKNEIKRLRRVAKDAEMKTQATDLAERARQVKGAANGQQNPALVGANP